MSEEDDILSAIEKGELFNGMDPLHYAAIMRIELDGKDPVLWAIENTKAINGEDPVLFALKNDGFDTNKAVLATARTKNHTIAIGSNNYSVDEFEKKVVECIRNKTDFEGLNPEDLMKIAVRGDFMIDGKSPIQYAIETNGDKQQGVKNILKEQGNKEQLKDFFKHLKQDPVQNKDMIKLFADEFNSAGRGKEDFVKIVVGPLIEDGAKVPDSIAELYIREQLSKDSPSIDKVHNGNKEQMFDAVVNLYLDEGTSKEDKAKLKIMYDQLALDLSIDTTKKDSALANFVADPEKCFNKINNLINQGEFALDMDGQKDLDLKSLYRGVDLETLEKLSEIGRKLEEHQPEAKNSSIAYKFGIALAVITVLPGIILGVIKLISYYQETQEIKEQLSEVLKVNVELNKFDLKDHAQDSNVQRDGVGKFTETILNVRSDSKGSSSLAK
ncbi:MAG: hypothetical protein ACI8ZF_000794 [Candidatus Midichloriaceae bacterium]|jgi:hypothetical protein